MGILHCPIGKGNVKEMGYRLLMAQEPGWVCTECGLWRAFEERTVVARCTGVWETGKWDQSHWPLEMRRETAREAGQRTRAGRRGRGAGTNPTEPELERTGHLKAPKSEAPVEPPPVEATMPHYLRRLQYASPSSGQSARVEPTISTSDGEVWTA
jgi:hypothetical protein